MANYTAADVKALREKSGAGMMDCKGALDEADGNPEKAFELLRLKGLKGVTKRAMGPGFTFAPHKMRLLTYLAVARVYLELLLE